MKTKHLPWLMAAFGTLLVQVSDAQIRPGNQQMRSILVTGATIHVGNGSVIENGAVGFDSGVIGFVGSAEEAGSLGWDKVIDASGKHVYPGFITPNSTLGLGEIDAVRASMDVYEIGTFRPNVRAVIAYDTESEITPTVRSNGVLIGQITPRGGTISGSSGVVQFDAWNWEDATITEVDGVHLNWPYTHHRHWGNGQAELRKSKTYDQQRHEIERFLTEAKAYCQQPPTLTDVKFAGLCGVFSGQHALYVHADDVRQISEAVHLKRKLGIERMVIVGARDSHLCADLLVENNIAVLLARVHSNPRFPEDDVDLTYKLPALLDAAGVRFGLENSGDMERMGTRNLPFYAGTAVAYGLDYEKAVSAITLNTAEILGIDHRYGSLERGKSATLFISEGDALDMRSNAVTNAWIDGRAVDLNNRQLMLYEKYKGKYD
jgi:imidazolonepropionase-like amidohydrolase